MVTQTTARQWVISQPGVDGKPGSLAARISTTENTKLVAIQLDKSLKDTGSGIMLPMDVAKDIGTALAQAADMSNSPFPGNTTPAPNA